VRGFDSLGIMLAAVAGQLANLLFMAVAWMHLKPTYSAEKHLQAMPK
jgi:hypothetical protein